MRNSHPVVEVACELLASVVVAGDAMGTGGGDVAEPVPLTRSRARRSRM